MKAQVLSSEVVRVTGVPASGARTRALEPYSCGSLQWDVPPKRRELLQGLVPKALLDMAERAPLPHDDQAVRVPSELWDSLYAYQKDGVRRIVHQFKGRCLLADEMGLGKTMQAVAVLLHYDCPSLVICPSFLQTNWRRALEPYTDKVQVCSYGQVPADGAYGAVVVDEAHYLKSLESQRTQQILPLLLRVPKVVLLSGTPCPNRPEELYALLSALRPKLVQTFTEFAHRYCRPRRTPFCHFDTRGSDRPDELKWLLGRGFWVRRTKAEVLPQLPAKRMQVLHCDADPCCAATMAELQGKLDTAMARGSKLAQTLVTEMYRETARAKTHSAVKLVVSRLVALQDPIIVFAHHRSVLDALQAGMPPGLKVARIDGGTPVHRRQAIVDQMQAGQLDVALLSMAAAGVGLTMTRACTAYFAEIPWCPAVLRQCEDRIHRIGQLSQCNIYYILAHGTLDAHVWRTIHRKERVAVRIGQ
jgi:SWI/SNF-related matrix-associated actin-dependent regulator 1 of chromatin subfamily A